jgi:hypothetical protein
VPVSWFKEQFTAIVNRIVLGGNRAAWAMQHSLPKAGDKAAAVQREKKQR